MSIFAIAAIGRNLGIADEDDNLLYKIKEDMKFFRDMTIGNTVIMGRKTFNSIGGALKGRYNIVISRMTYLYREDSNFKVTDFNTALNIVRNNKPIMGNNICIIGGAEIYDQFIEYCDYLYLTHYIYHKSEPTKFFPDPSLYGFNEYTNIKSGMHEDHIFNIYKVSKR